MTRAAGGRELVLDILLEVLEKGRYSHLVIYQALCKYQYLDKPERAFISRTAQGTIEYKLLIDYVINQHANRKVDQMKPVVRNLLRMSVYQLLYMDRVPDSAVCNEAVKLAKKRNLAGLSGFVNGVLRAVARNKETLSFPNDSVRYSMPEWIINMWDQEYGRETTRTMLGWFLKPSKTMVRCNLDLAGRQAILESLARQGVAAKAWGGLDALLCLEGYDYLEALEAFQKGWIQVQDLSSSLVGTVAGPEPGDYVIDLCGAPGGKALHLADLLKGKGMVEVRDVSEKKIQMIRENMDRAGFSNIRAKVQDALDFDPESQEKADLVIADLPCSGLGAIGRKPDIKYRMTQDQMEALAGLQRRILSVAWQYVKPGGRLVYSTCTIDKMENEDNAKWFLENHPFCPVNLGESLEGFLGPGEGRGGMVQLLPGIHPCDGFFIAAFQRNTQ